MKFKKLFLLVVLAFVAMSCEQLDDNTLIDSPVVEQGAASLSLQIAGTENVQTRAIGNASDEDKILKLDAFVFRTDGSLEAYKGAISTTNTITRVENIAVTSGAKKVFVLANYVGDLSQIKTLTELNSVVADLSNEKDNGRLTMATDVANVTIVSGKNYIGYNSSSDGVALSPFSYTLTRLVARVKLVDMQWQSSNYDFDNITAYVLNASKNSLLITSEAPTAPSAYYQGFAGVGNLYPSASTVLGTENNFLSTKAEANNTYFYLYPNQPVGGKVDYPTVLVLKAKVKQKGGSYIKDVPGYVDAEGYTYFPVVINKEGTSTDHTYVKRNTTYEVKTVVKGLGTSNPFSTAVAVPTLSAEVNVARWALNVTQTATFE